ncbi:MAG TPA: VOC family protein [Gammaproteobacteria bacterium]
MIIDHIGLAVSDYEKSKAFYVKALAPLGIELVMEIKGHAGFGRDGKPEFWISSEKTPGTRIHVAFDATSRDQVNAFHETALAAGALDNGAPGLRQIYHPDYYGAFVLDPDNHNIEAVCHKPE